MGQDHCVIFHPADDGGPDISIVCGSMHFSSCLNITLVPDIAAVRNFSIELDYKFSASAIKYFFHRVRLCVGWVVCVFYGESWTLTETGTSVLRSNQPAVLSNSNRHSKSKHNAILRSKHFYFSTCKPSVIPRGSLLFNCADHFATHSTPPFISLVHVAHA